jgi:hypothetical protein
MVKKKISLAGFIHATCVNYIAGTCILNNIDRCPCLKVIPKTYTSKSGKTSWIIKTHQCVIYSTYNEIPVPHLCFGRDCNFYQQVLMDILGRCIVTAFNKPCGYFVKHLLPIALKKNWYHITDKYIKIDPEANPISKKKHIKRKHKSYSKIKEAQAKTMLKKKRGKNGRILPSK